LLPIRRDKTAAFTLIELLTVVAITSVLLAVLIPSLRKARAAAKCATCQSNLRQLAQAWHMYLDDHDGCFLQGINMDRNYGGRQGERGVEYQKPKPLNKYLHLGPVLRTGAEVFSCPADQGDVFLGARSFLAFGTSYDMNHMLVGQNRLRVSPSDPCKSVMKKVSKRLKNLRRDKIANESKLLLMGDYGWRYQWYFETKPYKLVYWHDRPYHHSLAFMDGHVRFMRLRMGLNTTAEYTVIPFRDLQEAVVETQVEVTLPPPPPPPPPWVP
jgi:hypothetical protein